MFDEDHFKGRNRARKVIKCTWLFPLKQQRATRANMCIGIKDQIDFGLLVKFCNSLEYVGNCVSQAAFDTVQTQLLN